MTHVQIFRDPATNKPLWAVIHEPPSGSGLSASEGRSDLVDCISTVLTRVTGEGTAVLSASEITVEVL